MGMDNCEWEVGSADWAILDCGGLRFPVHRARSLSPHPGFHHCEVDGEEAGGDLWTGHSGSGMAPAEGQTAQQRAAGGRRARARGMAKGAACQRKGRRGKRGGW